MSNNINRVKTSSQNQCISDETGSESGGSVDESQVDSITSEIDDEVVSSGDAEHERQVQVATNIAGESQPPQNFGEISFNDSSKIQIGHRITYRAPVHITQHVYTGPIDEKRVVDARNFVNQNTDIGSKSSVSLEPGNFFSSSWSNVKKACSDIFTGTNSSEVPYNESTFRLQFVQRNEWNAERARDPPQPLSTLPAILVIISHTVTRFCFRKGDGARIVLSCQQHHKYANGWSDIGYNFLVGGDGLVYVGRGWGVVGAHTLNYNACSIGISLVGTFNEVEPSLPQLAATRNLIEYGVEHGHIARDYTLLGHRQCRDTLSPGNAAYKIIKSWEHWSPVVPSIPRR
ncbi:hypothetical protein TKK_0006617 [Trichogramma kaykai]|uniref:Uncharacterized protein n=1 Tax=Trichogramma kaykai TaxID=54128 RepID=A0ABD2XBS5_9HYME